MIVKELIDELLKLPQDALIGVVNKYGTADPIYIDTCDEVVDYEILYCDSQEDFDKRVFFDSELIYSKGYGLFRNGDDIPQCYMKVDEHGLPMLDTADWS